MATATTGYLAYLLAPSWPFVYLGLLLVMAWQSMGSPTLFAIVGDVLPTPQRAMGFTVQSILRRLPIAVAPTLGGLLIAALGVMAGFRLATAIAVLAGIATLLVVRHLSERTAPEGEHFSMRGVWRTFPSTLRRLLVADIFVRMCEGLVEVFLVLYALNVVGISAPQFGVLIAVQMTTAILLYVPAARWSDRTVRKPFVIATFVAFSVFPLAVVAAHSFAALVVAWMVAGLREIGEPSRKALIVDLAVPHLRGRSVGLYYFVRSIAISPAALLGGALWRQSPALPFYVAAAIGLVGTLTFAITAREAT